ncbi:MAG: MarR family winged helix-turn-helix transcriptional regulator [Parasphingopyxis sp.]|uniref:MarR family winged helix-turn-helix transcriptional regulator n=1 Tax=Parasphingopyxis sp. TaxID=1920299 RepID=UPI003FA0934F
MSKRESFFGEVNWNGSESDLLETRDDLLSGVIAEIEARALRRHLFRSGILADPGWDILLDLMRAKLTGKRISVSSACIASHGPATTGLRYIGRLVKAGYVARQGDPEDKRRVYVELTEAGLSLMIAYFSGHQNGIMVKT